MGLSLFSGIGGIDVALSEYVSPLVYCESNPFCQSVLLSRMQKGDLPKAPIWDDIITLRDALFDSGLIYEEIDILCAGFPSKDISIAGIGRGLEGKRSGLFFEIIRLAEEVKPTFIFLENIPAITTRGGLRVVKEIASLGYDCRWCVISAASIGARHQRYRWFMLAHSTCERGTRLCVRKKEGLPVIGNTIKSEDENVWKEDESPLLGVADDVSHWMDRIKALGNSVVPKQVLKAFLILNGIGELNEKKS